MGRAGDGTAPNTEKNMNNGEITFNQALKNAKNVDVCVMGPNGAIHIRVSKASARRSSAASFHGYPARETVSMLDGTVSFLSEDEESDQTLWSFDPANCHLLIG